MSKETENNKNNPLLLAYDGIKNTEIVQHFKTFDECLQAFDGWRADGRVLEFAQHMGAGAQHSAMQTHHRRSERLPEGFIPTIHGVTALLFYDYTINWQCLHPFAKRRYPTVAKWRKAVESTAFDYLNNRGVFRDAWGDEEKTLIIAQHAWGVSTPKAVETLASEALYHKTPFAWWLQMGGREVYDWVYERARLLRPSNAKFEKRLMPAWDAALGAYQSDIQQFIENEPLMSPVVRFQRIAEKFEEVEQLWADTIAAGGPSKDIERLAKTLAMLGLALNHFERTAGERGGRFLP